MKILNVDLYTQTLLWFVTSCTNWLEMFSLLGGKAHLPPNETLSLYHPKTIDKQEEQNNFYSKLM